VKVESSSAGETVAKIGELRGIFNSVHENLKDVFKKIDADGSGEIDIWEFRDALYESG
jgi:Ca2+-binding EF-hand superfamily protein